MWKCACTVSQTARRFNHWIRIEPCYWVRFLDKYGRTTLLCFLSFFWNSPKNYLWLCCVKRTVNDTVMMVLCFNGLQLHNKKPCDYKLHENSNRKQENKIDKQRFKMDIPLSDDWPELLHLQHGSSYSDQPVTDEEMEMEISVASIWSNPRYSFKIWTNMNARAEKT